MVCQEGKRSHLQLRLDHPFLVDLLFAIPTGDGCSKVAAEWSWIWPLALEQGWRVRERRFNGPHNWISSPRNVNKLALPLWSDLRVVVTCFQSEFSCPLWDHWRLLNVRQELSRLKCDCRCTLMSWTQPQGYHNGQVWLIVRDTI